MSKFSVLVLMVCLIGSAVKAQAFQLKCVDSADATKIFYLKDFRVNAALRISVFHSLYFPWMSSHSDHAHQDKAFTFNMDREILLMTAFGDMHSVLQIAIPWRNLDSGRPVQALYREGYDDSPSGAGQAGSATCSPIP